jgi:hypothetical protein
MLTASRRQGQTREGLSEGSPSAKMRADGQKSHRRPSLWVSQHIMTKPTGYKGQGKCGGCASKVHVLIRGDLSDKRLCFAMGAGLRPRPKGLEQPPDPTAKTAAHLGVIPGVFRQKSAEVIVGGVASNGAPLKDQTS